jgi:hypothetical protein
VTMKCLRFTRFYSQNAMILPELPLQSLLSNKNEGKKCYQQTKNCLSTRSSHGKMCLKSGLTPYDLALWKTLGSFRTKFTLAQYAQTETLEAADCRCRRMQTYADVCRRMQTYADVCRRMQTYADVCRRILTYPDVS